MYEKPKCSETRVSDLGDTAGILWTEFGPKILHKGKLEVTEKEVKQLKVRLGLLPKGVQLDNLPSQSSFTFIKIEEGKVKMKKRKQGHTIQTIIKYH